MDKYDRPNVRRTYSWDPAAESRKDLAFCGSRLALRLLQWLEKIYPKVSLEGDFSHVIKDESDIINSGIEVDPAANVPIIPLPRSIPGCLFEPFSYLMDILLSRNRYAFGQDVVLATLADVY